MRVQDLRRKAEKGKGVGTPLEGVVGSGECFQFVSVLRSGRAVSAECLQLPEHETGSRVRSGSVRVHEAGSHLRSVSMSQIRKVGQRSPGSDLVLLAKNPRANVLREPRACAIATPRFAVWQFAP